MNIVLYIIDILYIINILYVIVRSLSLVRQHWFVYPLGNELATVKRIMRRSLHICVT